jgi:LIVCS family branched-chain amino acid:cation transporter
MNNTQILNVGKYMFGFSFLLGNICLFGYLITRVDLFAVGGFMLLIFGSIVNLLFVVGLLIYGLTNRTKLQPCLRSTGILIINIPIATLYAFIGLNILK